MAGVLFSVACVTGEVVDNDVVGVAVGEVAADVVDVTVLSCAVKGKPVVYTRSTSACR